MVVAWEVKQLDFWDETLLTIRKLKILVDAGITSDVVAELAALEARLKKLQAHYEQQIDLIDEMPTAGGFQKYGGTTGTTGRCVYAFVVT